MGQYEYDETGAVFNYFLLSVLCIVLVPSTVSWVGGILGFDAAVPRPTKKSESGGGECGFPSKPDPGWLPPTWEAAQPLVLEIADPSPPCYTHCLLGLFARHSRWPIFPGVPACKCAPCVAKRARLDRLRKQNKPLVPTKAIFFLLGWALLGFVAYQVYITPTEEKGLWDPYDILELSE
ncbi:hypothetical protein HK405_001092, partial [Cladochytrium tenue]